jgi:hypothetical protein
LSIEERDTSAVRNAHWLGRALLLGFAWIFLFAIAYVLLDGFGLWQKLPGGLAQTIDVLTGAVLVFELFGHLGLAVGGGRSLPS